MDLDFCRRRAVDAGVRYGSLRFLSSAIRGNNRNVVGAHWNFDGVAMLVGNENLDANRSSTDDGHEALERILGSPEFKASGRRKEFLRYLVEAGLADDRKRLKAFAIAVDVFGRGDSFDSQTDPVVRLEARRLRRDLEHYYLTAGRQDPVRISIPKGGYAPAFEWQDDARPPTVDETQVLGKEPLQEGEPRPKGNRPSRWSWFAATVLVIAAVGALVWYEFAQDKRLSAMNATKSATGGEDPATAVPKGPRIAVVPFQNLSGDPGQDYLVHGISDRIVTDLARFKALLVISTHSSAEYQERSTDPQTLRQEFGVNYLLTGSVRRDEDQIRLLTRLVDAESGNIIWAGSYSNELTPSNVFEIQENVSQQVAATIGGRYGVIAEAGQTKARRHPPTSLSAYECVLRYYHHQRLIERREHAEVRACLERAVKVDPQYADAWAVLANVYAQEYRFGYNPRAKRYDSLEQSFAAAKRAVDLEPRNPTAQLMFANALFDRHDFIGFRAAGEQAIMLNPNDPETLAHFGTRLVYMGEWERGFTLASKAIALDPEHPGWYRSPPIFYYYQLGNYEQALVQSNKQRASRLWPLLFRAMILGQLVDGI